MILAYAVVFGLIIGSFASVIVERLGRRGGIVAGRSECVHCKQRLGALELIPVFSFLFLGGKCRHCRKAISVRYLVIELVMSGAFAGYVLLNGFSGVLSALELGIIAGLIMLFFFDMRHYVLPDEILVPTALLAVARIAVAGTPEPVSVALGGLFFLALFGALHTLSSGRWMGFGDVGLGAVLGIILGWPSSLFVLVFSVWAGALVGGILMIVGRAHMKTALPFGSFLTAVAVGALIRQDLFEQLSSLFSML